MEWLRANRLGAYSSSTAMGCNTRRYHGLLVAATHPPAGRVVALATVMEQLVLAGQPYDLATNEFPGTFSPNGWGYLTKFRDGPAVAFVYTVQDTTLTKRVLLSEDANAVLIRYELTGPVERLVLRPFTPLRDFHALRHVGEPHQMTLQAGPRQVVVTDAYQTELAVCLQSPQACFHADPQWWYRLLYRVDLARGQDALEDLYSPGRFVWEPGRRRSCTLIASLGEPTAMPYHTALARVRRRQAELLKGFRNRPRPVRRLTAATDAYLVRRKTKSTPEGASILAGFPWFGDWGRDTFIALPGLLLCTRRFELARRVFQTYADALDEGMIPNRFDDYAGPAHYNSVDASLWFVIAADRYLRATGDEAFWQDVLRPACETILSRYAAGTRFGIRADADGLLLAGSRETQLTWMDAKLGEKVITGRWGKAVEVNALWYAAHCFLADRLRPDDPAGADRYRAMAQRIGGSFVRTFWNENFAWLNDVVNDEGVDASLRPNQIFAVSLPFSPLSPEQQAAVVQAVQENLLTPRGLRTLSPRDRRYRSRYGGSRESRERAYHQGTVWAWLIGAFIEAYLKVENAARNPAAIAQAKVWLSGFDEHLDEAGLGQISEIFDGGEPHAPHGCFAQAWSVAEVLRAKQLVAQLEARDAS